MRKEAAVRGDGVWAGVALGTGSGACEDGCPPRAHVACWEDGGLGAWTGATETSRRQNGPSEQPPGPLMTWWPGGMGDLPLTDQCLIIPTGLGGTFRAREGNKSAKSFV